MTTPTLGIRPEDQHIDVRARAFQLRRERLIQNLRVGAASQRSRGDTAYASLLEDAADEIELQDQEAERRRALHAPAAGAPVAEADGLPLLSTIRDTPHLRRIVDTAHHNGIRAGMDKASGAWVKVCKALGLDPHTAGVADVIAWGQPKTPPAVGDNPGTQLGGGFAPVGAVDLPPPVERKAYFPAAPSTLVEVQLQDGPIVSHQGWVVSPDPNPPGYYFRVEADLWANLSPQAQAMVRQIGEEVARVCQQPASKRSLDPVEEAMAEAARNRATLAR